mmetsp:Transcript_1853/g.2602  ORF Transcript_1853/g.2602 Transcript_1853/m.2602 type:complete len:240 (+) Transcript_1853:293-1012(+)
MDEEKGKKRGKPWNRKTHTDGRVGDTFDITRSCRRYENSKVFHADIMSICRYFIQPSSEHVSQVVNGKAAKKSPAFRYVKPTGVKTENANKIFYVKKLASQNDTKFGHPVTSGMHESSAKQDGNGYLECIFCDEIPDVIYMNSLCSHIGCRKCWLGWCKDHLDNLKCPKCGIKTELANVSMITAYERRKLLTFHNGNLDDSKGMNKVAEGNLDAIDESDLDDDSDGLETSVTHCDTKYP